MTTASPAAGARSDGPTTSVVRRLPVGAEVQPGGGVHFRVWAPKARRVEVVLDGGPAVELAPENGGYFAGLVREARAGSRYRYHLDGRDSYPDPASRYQPEGPHGPSEVVDSNGFAWTDRDWPGLRRDGQVLYELHVGTFTPEGTWEAAARELPALADLGVTCVEVMPVAEFPGRFGWGYDGVGLFAPTRLYGTPDDLRRFIDRAHALGLGVILDVVYNHLGPDGNYLKAFADEYFSKVHVTDWGEAINFDGAGSGPVREFFVANGRYWVDEFHLDGYRYDATQNIYDTGPDHILGEVVREARRAAARRSLLMAAENEPQHVRILRPADRGGLGLDMLWNDDFHHSAAVALTGRNEAYYTDYQGTPQEFLSAAKWGYLFQGQWYRWQKKRRGTPSFGVPPAAFVTFIENHDQLANSGRGLRQHRVGAAGSVRALTALLLLGPGTPMLFQGQEFQASTPWYYFADHNPELAGLVRRGRAAFLAQFPSLASPEIQSRLPDPADPATFAACKLDHRARAAHAGPFRMHRDLLRLRREDATIRAAQRPGAVDGAVLGPEALVLRFFSPAGPGGDDRLLLVNLGKDLHVNPAPEPLLAPPEGRHWEVRFSTEHPDYGGTGTPPIDTPDDNWHVPGRAAVLLAPAPGAPPGPAEDPRKYSGQP
jgi:maltooligosyltrehalose trehalohydrolase